MKKFLFTTILTLVILFTLSVLTHAQQTTGALGGSTTGGDAWAPGGADFSGSVATAGASTTVLADLKYCKTVTASNAAYCCGVTAAGTVSQCKNYVLNTNGFQDAANAGYCKEFTGMNAYNFCCLKTTAGGSSQCSAAQTRLSSTATSPGGRYTDATFCQIVSQYNASYCCAVTTAGGAQCADYKATDKEYKTASDNLFCTGTITDENSNYCCSVARIGDLVQCSVSKDTVKKYSRETVVGVNKPDFTATPEESALFCLSPLASNGDTVNYCCNTTNYGEIGECKKFIKSGGLRGSSSEGAANLKRAQESCSTITLQNAEMCCVVYRVGPADQCKDYLGAGTVGGVNGGTQITNNVLQNGFLGGGSVAQPQASAAELQACTAIKFISLLDIVIWVKCIIVSAVIPLIFTLAFLVFLWGIFRFISSSDKTKKEDAKNYIIWGMVGLFVMVSLWGIIKILGDTLGIQSAVPLLKTEYLPNSTTKATTK